MADPKPSNQSRSKLPIPEDLRTFTERLVRGSEPRTPPHAALHASPIGKELAKQLSVVLDLDRIIHLTGLAEREGLLPQGKADRLREMARQHNPYLAELRKLVLDADLAVLDPDIIGVIRGRPNKLRWALMADILAVIVRRRTPDRIWPVVSELLAEPLKQGDSALLTDPKHLKQLVDEAKRRFKEKLVDEWERRFGEKPRDLSEWRTVSKGARREWRAARADLRSRAE